VLEGRQIQNVEKATEVSKTRQMPKEFRHAPESAPALIPGRRTDPGREVEQRAGTRIRAPSLFKDIIYACNFGIDFWANRLGTFDIPDKALIVSVK
jgi:hypothetical protein